MIAMCFNQIFHSRSTCGHEWFDFTFFFCLLVRLVHVVFYLSFVQIILAETASRLNAEVAFRFSPEGKTTHIYLYDDIEILGVGGGGGNSRWGEGGFPMCLLYYKTLV